MARGTAHNASSPLRSEDLFPPRFGRQLGISPAALSTFVRSKNDWSFSNERAKEIVELLDLPIDQKNRFLRLLGFETDLPVQEVPGVSTSLFLKPFYLPLLIAFDLPERLRSTVALAARFGIPVSAVKTIAEEFVTAGFLSRVSESFTRTPSLISINPQVPSEAIRESHFRAMDFARDAAEAMPLNERDLSTLYFTGSAGQIAEGREELLCFQKKMISIFDRGEANDELYQLSIQLVPVRLEET
jgi:hypothetical protein